jgi:hypothetical protein
MKKSYWSLVLPLVIAFIIISVATVVGKAALDASKVNPNVLLGANGLLFLFSMLNVFLQTRNARNPNPNAMVRGVMAGMILKLFGLGAAVIIYLMLAGQNKSVYAIFAGMGLYVVYTWLEVRITLQLKPGK